jgi:predicted nucleic acid-binding protein
MILADTSVWVDHLRKPEPVFWQLLEQQLVFVHPYVVGELALGNLKDRAQFIAELKKQPQAKKALDGDVLTLIENNKLFGKGIGYVDAHLLASARICNAKIWTRDKRFHAVAINLGLAELY